MDGYFNKDKFMEHLHDAFPTVFGFGCHYKYEMAENIIRLAMEEKNGSPGQIESFLSEMLPEVTEGEVERYTKRNTRIRYTYRDAANDHILQDVVLAGILTQEQESGILENRIDGGWFDPQLCGLPMPSFTDEGFKEDDELDHDWCELGDDAFEYTDDEVTENSVTAGQFCELATG